MDREHLSYFGIIFGWALASITPSVVLQVLSAGCTVLAGVNWYYSIKEKRANIKKINRENAEQGSKQGM